MGEVNKMKRVFSILMMALLIAGPAAADEVDQGLPAASEQLKASTRTVIRSGVGIDDAVRMTRIMLENRFKMESMLRAHQLIRQAQAESLPVEPLVSKALEGMTKRVPEERIILAMEKVRFRYAEAYRYTRDLADSEEARRRLTSHMAEAMTAGMMPFDLERIIHQFRFQSRDMDGGKKAELGAETFATTKELARHGVSSRGTADLMCEALKQRYQAREMAQLRSAFKRHSQNTSAAVVAEGYLDAVMRGQNVETLDFSPGHGPRGGSGPAHGLGTGGGAGSGAGGGAQGGGTSGSGGSGQGGPGKGYGGPGGGGRR